MKSRRTREIVIELTSLLDVVLILIFAVLMQNAKLLDKKDNLIDSIESENAVLKGENEALLGKLEALLGDDQSQQDINMELIKDLLAELDRLDAGTIEDLLNKIDQMENREDALDEVGKWVKVVNVTLDYRRKFSYLSYKLGESELIEEDPIPYYRNPDADNDDYIGPEKQDNPLFIEAAGRFGTALVEYINEVMKNSPQDTRIYIMYVKEHGALDKDNSTIDEVIEGIVLAYPEYNIYYKPVEK